MQAEDVQAVINEVRPEADRCRFTADVHRFLTELARRAGFIEAIGLRAAAGAITHLRRKLGCI
jgi:hypothetical protein